MEKGIQISFIIVNYQSLTYLKRCLVSLQSNTNNIQIEAIVVNNDNFNLGILPVFSFPVRIIEMGKNAGFGPANNIGAKEAKGEILFFINADTEFVNNGIQNIISEFQEKKLIGIIGPKLLSDSGKTQWWSAGREIDMTDLILNNIGIYRSRKIWESVKKIETDWVSGAAFCIRKDLFHKLGGFDEKFFMYYEDVDLCRRVRDKGYKIIYFPEIKIKHFGGKSFADKKIQKKYFYASQDYYFQKHFGKTKGAIVKILRKVFHSNVK